MILSISHQSQTFLISLLVGVLIGIFYDLFRFFRKKIFHKNIITYIEDIIFWLFVTFFSYITLLHISSGEVRIYYIIGIFLGFCINFVFISFFILKLLDKIYQIFVKTFKITIKPINYTVKKSKKPMKYVKGNCYKAKFRTTVRLKKTSNYGKIYLRKCLTNIKIMLNKI